jgi:hypothetical protein
MRHLPRGSPPRRSRPSLAAAVLLLAAGIAFLPESLAAGLSEQTTPAWRDAILALPLVVAAAFLVLPRTRRRP